MDYCENGCDAPINDNGHCLQCGHYHPGHRPETNEWDGGKLFCDTCEHDPCGCLEWDDDESLCPDCGNPPNPGVFCEPTGGFHHPSDCECDWCLYS